MAVFHARNGKLVAHVKGAPRRILDMTAAQRTVAGDRTLDAEGREELLAANVRLAASGLRVIAVAEGAVAEASEASLHGLTFTAYIGLMDPPAPGVKEAIATLRRAGLRTIMLTGDQRFTAEAIGRDLGVLTASDEALDGRELRQLSADALQERLGRVGTFSSNQSGRQTDDCSSVAPTGPKSSRCSVTESMMRQRSVKPTSGWPWAFAERTSLRKRRRLSSRTIGSKPSRWLSRRVVSSSTTSGSSCSTCSAKSRRDPRAPGGGAPRFTAPTPATADSVVEPCHRYVSGVGTGNRAR